jgi:MFS family permease
VHLSDEPADDLPDESLSRNVKVVGWASLLNDTASEMIYPLLPHFLLTVLHGNRLYLGLIEGIADSVACFVKLWSGDQSDQSGRRKGFIVLGYCVPAVVRPLIGLIVAPWQLFAIRTLDRIGKGIRSSPRDALIADSTPAAIRGRAFGFQRAMDNFGAAIGPLLAAAFLWLWPSELRTLFLIAFVPGVLVVILLVFGLKERLEPNSPPEPSSPLNAKPFDRDFKLYLLSLVIFTLGNCSDAFLLVRAGELGVTPMLLPLLWCACHIAKSGSNLLLGRVVDFIGPRTALLIGWFFFAVVYLGFGMATRTQEMWVYFILYGVVYGLIEPAERTLVSAIVGTERKGLAYGWFNFAIGIATLPASLIFGALYQFYGSIASFTWGAGLALLAAMLLTMVSASRVRRTGRKTTSP